MKIKEFRVFHGNKTGNDATDALHMFSASYIEYMSRQCRTTHLENEILPSGRARSIPRRAPVWMPSARACRHPAATP